jgi:aminopeptidase-like protein
MTDHRPDSSVSGTTLHALLADLFPICRSLTGEGVRKTLARIGDIIPLDLHEIPTGTEVFDWTIPKEWGIQDAYIEDGSGRRLVDFRENNLHVVGYSAPVDEWLTLDALQPHLHSLPEKPDAIPFLTSYYKESWGFCLTHRQRAALAGDRFHAVIKSELKDGSLTLAECLIPGETGDEIFLSTYICHPSMANNELSGPVVAAFIGQWLRSAPRRFTYRIAFVPETIGALAYLSLRIVRLKKNVIAGFVLSCLGDDRAHSMIASRRGNTLADRIASAVLATRPDPRRAYSFLARGSDERQYCSPGADLPMVVLCRSRFGDYPEYHTSLDNLDLVTPAGLEGGFRFVRDCIELAEQNFKPRATCTGEPQLGKRGLYHQLSTGFLADDIRTIKNVLVYADGETDLIEIARLIEASPLALLPVVARLRAAGLIEP